MKLIAEYDDKFKNNTVNIVLDIKKNMLEVIRESAFSYFDRENNLLLRSLISCQGLLFSSSF